TTGGRIKHRKYRKNVTPPTSGSIFVHGTEDFDICLPTYTSPLRDRFTIAHELGHYFLHSDQGEIPIVAFRNGSTRIEWEANWFAASLLMPKAEFRQAASRDLSVAALAARFGVSQEAARVRKEALGE
ncbi:MAG: ImmA/IrrE family metallo-endopeptidase, partial [Planctomycetales bacterium]